MKKKEYYNAKAKYRHLRTQVNYAAMKRNSKDFKRVINKNKTKNRREFQNKLRRFKGTNPKEHWFIINNKGRTSVSVPLKELYDHVKSMSEVYNDGDYIIDQTSVGDLDANILDEKIHAEEIRKCVKDLKNNKAAGIDYIY